MPYGSLQTAADDIPRILFRSVDNMLELQKTVPDDAKPWLDMVAMSASETGKLTVLFGNAHSLIADMSLCLKNYARDLSVNMPADRDWTPLLLGMTDAAHKASTTAQKWDQLEVRDSTSQRRNELLERREENLVGIATGASLAAGSFHASPLIAGVGSAVALAGMFARRKIWPPTKMAPPPSAAGAAVLEMPDLILSAHSFLELLRRDTQEWCRLVRDNPEGMQASELRDRLLAACELYLMHSGELRRRLRMGMKAAAGNKAAMPNEPGGSA